MKELSGKFQKIYDGFVFPYTLPPVIGLGTGGGFEMQLLDKGNLGFQALDQAGTELALAAKQQPVLNLGIVYIPIHISERVRRHRSHESSGAQGSTPERVQHTSDISWIYIRK